MTSIKILSGINWLLIGVYGGFIVWALLQKANPYNDLMGCQKEQMKM